MEQIPSASHALDRLASQQARITDAYAGVSGTNTKNLFGISLFGFGLPAGPFQTGSQKKALKAKEQFEQILPELTKISKAIEKALDQAYTSEGKAPVAVKKAIEGGVEAAQGVVDARAATVTKNNDSIWRA